MTSRTDAAAGSVTGSAARPARNGGAKALIGVMLVGAAALALAVWFVLALIRAVPPPAPDVGDSATVLRVPMQIPPFALTDHRGERFDESRLADRWTFLFFGYTYCPDVCPVTLASLRDARALMAEQAGEGDLSDLQFVFVSVDPERDTLDRLAQYVPYFHPEFIGATGEPEDLEPLTGALGVYHERTRGEAGEREEGYLLDHTVSVMLIDPDAKLHAIFAEPHEPAEVARTFALIRAHGESR